MPAELGLAIDSCVTETTSLVVVIFKKIREVVKFKGKCKQLGKEAKHLQFLLEVRSNAIKDLQTVAEFRTCFADIENFVESCTKRNTAQVVWEVLYTRDFPAIRKRISALKDVFLLESVTEILARETGLTHAVKNVHAEVKVGVAVQKEILSNLKAQNQASVAARSRPFSARTLEWDTLDPSLHIHGDLDIIFEGNKNKTGKAMHPQFGSVVCYKIEPTTFTQTALKLYREVQYGAFVQRLFGLTRVHKNVYAVMESVDEHETLAHAISSNTLPSSALERLQLAHDVAKSMAWYHRAEMKLKSHSDDTIVLKTLPSRRRCAVMTRLEGARHFLEQTSGVSYDLRYEAFEYDKTKEHSKHTDVFSLGTLIWQIMGSEFPYGMSQPATPQARTECSELQNKLSQKVPPGRLERLPAEIAGIVERCWNLNAMLRPTSAEVAMALQDIIAEEASKDENSESTSDGEASASESSALELSGQLDDAIKLIRKARMINFESPTIKPVPENISIDAFESLMNDDDWTAVQYFAVGALILWKLTEYRVTALHRAEATSLILNDEVDRARTALFYLESAAAMGYEEANFEMYKAHALLARELKAMSKDTIEQMRKDRSSEATLGVKSE